MNLRILRVAALALAASACTWSQTRSDSLTVAGRVVDSEGRPLAGATVLADNGGSYQVMKEWAETPWRKWVPDPVAAASTGPFTRRANAPTGPDGRFRVDEVSGPAGKGWVVVVHPDYATARVDAKGGAEAGVLELGDVVLRKGAEVRVTVRAPDGKPAAGAWVVARSATPTSPAESPSSWASGDEPGDVRVGRTAEDGACRIPGLTPGKLRVAAFTAAHVPAVVEVEGARAGAIVEASISLVAGSSLRVEVAARDTRAPVAGARVRGESPEAGTSWPGPAPLAIVTTDRSGVAAIEGLETRDEYRVIVVPPDFASDSVHHPGAFHVAAMAKPGETVKVALTPPRRLAVSVIDAVTKAPLAGARVRLRADWARFDHSGGQAIDLDPKWEAATETYVSPHARPGPWIASAWAPGHLPSLEIAVRVEAGDPPSTAIIALQAASGSAAGRVVDQASGALVPGASVSSYEWVERLGDGNRATATTGQDGAFRLAPLMGEGFPLRLEVAAEGYVAAVKTWPPEGRRPDLGDLALQRAAMVRGRVTDARGRPLARVGVSLLSFDDRSRGKGDGWSATTDDSGRFRFGGLPPGRYLLEGQRDSSPIRVGGGETAERDLVR